MPFNPFGAKTYNLSGSISSTATSITLSSFTEPVTGTPYTMALLNTDIVYATIAPKTNSSEFISFTGITQNADGTATLTGVTRGLAKKYPFTTDAAYKLPHSGQSEFIVSDLPQLFDQYASLEDDETVTGQWTFNNFPITPDNSDASTTVKGVTKLSTAPASATEPIAVGTNDSRVPVAYAVDAAGSDAYAITPSPAETAYVAGKEYTFKAGTANTGACTLNVSGLGAKTIKKNVSDDLATGDILVNQIVVCKYDGTNMQMISVSAAPAPVINVYTSDGTWTKPAGLKYIKVEVVGGGGGSGGATSTSGAGSGGGGGGYSMEIITASALGATEEYDVGAGGVSGGTGNGGAGGTSNFGTTPFLQATGGGGGIANVGSGGAGGVGSNGNLNIAGQGGGASNALSDANIGGTGGSSFYGGGGRGIRSLSDATTGEAGGNYGGGASGGSAINTIDASGAAGAAGVVIVTEYFS